MSDVTNIPPKIQVLLNIFNDIKQDAPSTRPRDILPRKLTAWTWSHEGLEDEFPLEDGCFQKYGYPKMEGENNGHPY